MMSTYIEIPVEDIELDKSNPRIARGIAYYGENITSETMALLLGSTSEACASLRESIRENGGIIHPIVVNKRTGNSYVVIEGNTRLQIYKDFIIISVLRQTYFLMNGIILKILYSRSQLDSKALFQLCQSLYQMGKQRGISANNALYRCLNS